MNPEFRVFQDLFLTIGKHGISDDESGEETVHGVQRKVYREIHPGWRSDELRELYYSLDDAGELMRASRVVASRRPAGSEPRIRIRTDPKVARYCNNDRPAPPGLARNCYNTQWLAGRRDWEIEALKIQEGNYIF